MRVVRSFIPVAVTAAIACAPTVGRAQGPDMVDPEDYGEPAAYDVAGSLRFEQCDPDAALVAVTVELQHPDAPPDTAAIQSVLATPTSSETWSFVLEDVIFRFATPPQGMEQPFEYTIRVHAPLGHCATPYAESDGLAAWRAGSWEFETVPLFTETLTDEVVQLGELALRFVEPDPSDYPNPVVFTIVK